LTKFLYEKIINFFKTTYEYFEILQILVLQFEIDYFANTIKYCFLYSNAKNET